MGDLVLTVLNSPTFQTLASTFLASVVVDSTIAGIRQVRDAIKNKPHEAQLLDTLEQAFFVTELEVGWKHDTEAIYASFFCSLFSFTGSFTKDSLSRIFVDAVKTEVTDEQVSVWITNVLKQLSYPSHTDLREFLKLKQILDENSEPSRVNEKYILTPNSSVCENNDTIGREPLITELLEMLEREHDRIQLKGMGGLGKTETLKKLYAKLAKNRKIASFDYVGLIRFSGDILSDIESQVDYPRQYLGFQGVEAAKRYLRDICQESKVLLCLDDIREKQPLLDEHNTSIEFLRSLSASILLAARAAYPDFEVLELQFLSTDACVQIFERKYGRSITNEEDLVILRDIIENYARNHTMIVNRLGNMAKDFIWSIPVLSEKLKEKNFNFAKSMRDDELLQQEINKLYPINATLSKAERNLLEAFSIFPAAPLSVDLCVVWLHEDAGIDDNQCSLLLNKLAEQTWLVKLCGSDSGDVFFLMHHLVRTAVQEHIDVQYTAHQTLVQNCTVSLNASTENYDFEKSLVITRFAIPLQETLYQASEPFALLASKIAIFYFKSANFQDALVWFRKTISISEAVFGDCHLITALSYDYLGSLFFQIGDYDKALEWHRKSLDVIERVLGIDNLQAANCFSNVALALEKKGNYDESIEWNIKALIVREKLLGKDNPLTATTYNNIASAYSGKGQLKLSLDWYQKSLDIRERLLGIEHPDTAATYVNIATVLEDLGDYIRAQDYNMKATAIYISIYGELHPTTATCYNNIAFEYNRQGNYDEAIKWHKKALKIRESVLGTKHPDTGQSYNNIAGVFLEKKEGGIALEWLMKSLCIFEFVFGENHFSTFLTCNNIASAYSLQSDYNVAYDWYARALKISTIIFGQEHHNVAICYYNIAHVCSSQGDYNLALVWLHKALSIFETRLGSEHTYTIQSSESIKGIENMLEI